MISTLSRFEWNKSNTQALKIIAHPQVLSLRRCARLSDEAVSAVARNGRLQRLAVSNVHAFGPLSMAALASCCSESLEYLDISFCRCVAVWLCVCVSLSVAASASCCQRVTFLCSIRKNQACFRSLLLLQGCVRRRIRLGRRQLPAAAAGSSVWVLTGMLCADCRGSRAFQSVLLLWSICVSCLCGCVAITHTHHSPLSFCLSQITSKSLHGHTNEFLACNGIEGSYHQASA